MNSIATALLAVFSSAAPDGPLFVVESSHAWVPAACDGAAPLAGPGADEAKRLQQTAQLVLIHESGVLPVTLGSPVCFRGECGADQIGLPMERERGLVAPRSLVGLAVPLVEMREQDGLALPSCLDAAAPLPVAPSAQPARSCVGFATADRKRGIQVRGVGAMQENGWPLFDDVQFRELARVGSRWTTTPWRRAVADATATTNLPRPVAVSFAKETRIFWVHAVGICCPSDSRAWMTTTGDRSSEVKFGTTWKGGRGQPCD